MAGGTLSLGFLSEPHSASVIGVFLPRKTILCHNIDGNEALREQLCLCKLPSAFYYPKGWKVLLLNILLPQERWECSVRHTCNHCTCRLSIGILSIEILSIGILPIGILPIGILSIGILSQHGLEHMYDHCQMPTEGCLSVSTAPASCP